MASINPNILDCRYSPHVSGKTDNRCRITVTEITQDINANQTRIKGKVTVEGTPYSYLYALLVQIGGKTIYDHHTGGAILTSWKAGQVICTFDEIYDNNPDGTLTLYAYIKQMFYYGNGNSSRWNNPNFYQDNDTNMVCSTIPRTSSITSGADFTKGDSVTVSISRASSDFQHTVQFFVGNTLIREVYGVATSTTWTPTQGEVETMLSKDMSSRIVVLTYNNGNYIGYSEKYGTAYNPTTSYIQNDFNLTVGGGISFEIARNKSYYTHSLEISTIFNGITTLIKTITNIGTNTDWTPNSSELTAIYDAMKATSEAVLSVKCITYSRGANIGNTTKPGRIIISEGGNEPIFNDWTYKNKNEISNDILGTNQVMLQNNNSILIVCDSATAKNGAYISKYQVVVNNTVYETTDIDAREITIPVLKLSGSVLFQVRAIDSRGFSKTVEKKIQFIPYTEPDISQISLERHNSYDEESKMKLSGIISLISYNNQSKNEIVEFKYRFKDNTTSEYGGWVDILTSTIPDTAQKFHYDNDTGKFYLDETEIGNFDKDKTYQFEFVIRDKVNTYTFSGLLINGLPLIALRKERVGINCVPDINGKPGLYINGNYVAFEKTIYEGSNSINNIIYDEELNNPTYVIIEYQADKLNGSVRIDNPIGKQVSLIIVDPATMTLYSKAITITETGIQVNSQSKTILGGNSSNSNDIAITRVIKGN
jgi:hypothetical protein